MTDPPHRSIDLAPLPARVLAIGAHPDDVEFGCGATLAKWAEVGCETHVLVLTDGSKGSWDPDTDPVALAATRRREQQDAAAVLGLARVHTLDLVDGELAAGHTEREAVSALLRQLRPDVVLGHDPWKRYRLHPDHREAGRLAIDAIVAARDPHFFPEQLDPPHRPDRLLLFEAEVVDHLEGLEARHVDAKIGALLRHRSQWRSTMGIDAQLAATRAAFERRIRDEAASAGREAGVAAAEAFKLLDAL